MKLEEISPKLKGNPETGVTIGEDFPSIPWPGKAPKNVGFPALSVPLTVVNSDKKGEFPQWKTFSHSMQN